MNGLEKPYDNEGRDWLHGVLPRFVRDSGFNADKRVARILKSGGPDAVLAEISRIDSTYVKGIYFKQLFAQASLSPAQYRQVMAQAGREMHSDYELATLLTGIADRIPDDEASRAAYFAAASGISSDYELHRVYATMLKKGPVSPEILAGILEHASSIHSDYELSQLLQQIVRQQRLDDRSRPLFFKALENVDGAYERHQVLSAVLRTGDSAVLAPALEAGSQLSSAYEASQFLLDVLRAGAPEGSLRAPFFRAVNALKGSSYEMGQVLQAVVSRQELSRDTLLAALRSASLIDGSYERSQVLIAAANSHALTGDLGDAYIDATKDLGDYESGQALAALAKSERRK